MKVLWFGGISLQGSIPGIGMPSNFEKFEFYYTDDGEVIP